MVDTFWPSVGGGVLVDIFCVVVGGVGYILAAGRWKWMVVGGVGYILAGGGWWWIYFGWLWVVVDIFWLVVGGGGWWHSLA